MGWNFCTIIVMSMVCDVPSRFLWMNVPLTFIGTRYVCEPQIIVPYLVVWRRHVRLEVYHHDVTELVARPARASLVE